MKLTNCGITIDVNPVEAQRYLAAGYTIVKEEPAQKPAQPQADKPKTRKVAKKEVNNGNN